MKRSKLFKSNKWTIKEVKKVGAHLEDPSYLCGGRVSFSVVRYGEWLGRTRIYRRGGAAEKFYKGV